MFVNELNCYPPGTEGFILVGSRYHLWWVRGKIWGRVCNHRRAIDEDGNHWFLDVGHQFALEPEWPDRKVRLYQLSKI